MTDPNYTHLLLIVDRSGSMHSISRDMNGGITNLLEEQAKLPGKILVDAWRFDTEVDHVAEGALPDADALEHLVDPRGSTALYDAIGQAVSNLGIHFAALEEDERPGKVVVVIVTDGAENASREWDDAGVRKLLKEQQEAYSWQVVFLGANLDSAKVGGSIGLSKGRTMDYSATSKGVASAWATTSGLLASYRGGATASMVYTDADRDAAKGEDPEPEDNNNSPFKTVRRRLT